MFPIGHFIFHFVILLTFCKADIRNPLSLLAHERSRFATCQWELLTPTDISIPLTHRLVLYALEAGNAYSAFNFSLIHYFLFFSHHMTFHSIKATRYFFRF